MVFSIEMQVGVEQLSDALLRLSEKSVNSPKNSEEKRKTFFFISVIKCYKLERK